MAQTWSLTAARCAGDVDHTDPHEVQLGAQQDLAVIRVLHHLPAHPERYVSESAVIDMLRTAQ